jgi:hypothetical protein
MAWMTFEWPMSASKKSETLTRNGMTPIGVIMQRADGRRCTLDRWGRVQWWHTDEAGAMTPNVQAKRGAESGSALGAELGGTLPKKETK